MIFPFNLVKSTLNASIAMLIYKPISKVLKRMGVAKTFAQTNVDAATNGSENVGAVNKTRSLVVAIASAILMIVAFLVLFFVLGGKLS